ncbi:hypothetical protein TNCV_3345851 [Trichonephila clavipes]|nr:hypothetical protein TNCV_3345851 [Trichonephila clavipes]
MRQCRGQNIPKGESLLKEKAKAFAKELESSFRLARDNLQILKKEWNSLQKCVGKAQVSTLTFVLSGRTRSGSNKGVRTT